MDQRRPRYAETSGEGRGYPRETIDGERSGITAGYSDGREPDSRGNRRLASRAVVYAVIK